MMKMKSVTKTTGQSVVATGAESGAAEWEVRPGGMLVQKRSPDSNRSSGPPPPTIRVRVKFGSIHHDINISSQATFGELKKILAGQTGLHHQDQKLYYKDKERESSAFLDMSGVKDKSKIVLVEDPISQEKRLLEIRKNAKMEKASKCISDIGLEVDRLATQVSALETIISKGGKVVERDVLNLIELLMNQLLKLDGIIAEGDVKLQRKMQVRRVQKYVETLDMIKVKNSMTMPNDNGVHKQMKHRPKKSSFVQKLAPIQEQPQPKYSTGPNATAPLVELQPRHSVGHAVVTTQWETFDTTPALVPVPSTSTSIYALNNSAHHPKFPWDFFD